MNVFTPKIISIMKEIDVGMKIDIKNILRGMLQYWDIFI